MQDLLKSVRQRYKAGMNFNNLFTLSYRVRRQSAKLKLETADLERGILRTVNSDILRHAEQWKQQVKRMEKQRIDADKRVKRQNDLIFTDINLRIKRLGRELAALKALEKERREDSELTRETITSLTKRATKHALEEHTDRSSASMHTEINCITKKAVRNALRQMREEQEYERRRG